MCLGTAYFFFHVLLQHVQFHVLRLFLLLHCLPFGLHLIVFLLKLTYFIGELLFGFYEVSGATFLVSLGLLHHHEVLPFSFLLLTQSRFLSLGLAFCFSLGS